MLLKIKAICSLKFICLPTYCETSPPRHQVCSKSTRHTWTSPALKRQRLPAPATILRIQTLMKELKPQRRKDTKAALDSLVAHSPKTLVTKRTLLCVSRASKNRASRCTVRLVSGQGGPSMSQTISSLCPHNFVRAFSFLRNDHGPRAVQSRCPGNDIRLSGAPRARRKDHS